MQTTFHIQIRISIRSLAMFLIKTWRSIAFGLYGYTNFTKSGFLEHAKKFKQEDMQARIEGKNCIITGANSGIGYATAEGLASRGATVYMICRNKERGEAALSRIQTVTGNKNVHLEVCDISSISDIKSFASRFSLKDVPVHILVNNAGLLENKRIITSEGYEMNFAVNVLGTYTMTESMLSLIEKAAPDARVITVSSGGMYTAPLTEDLQFNGNKFNGVEQYARNKRIQVALTEKWAEMYKDRGIGFYSMHPGWAETPGVAKSYRESLEQVRKVQIQLYGWHYNQKKNSHQEGSISTELKHLSICHSQPQMVLVYTGQMILQTEQVISARSFAKSAGSAPPALKGDEMLKGIFLEVKKKFETSLGILRKEKITINPDDPAAVSEYARVMKTKREG